jgi:hypothetical protein
MANEAVLIYETEIPIPFTCADNAGIEKGTVLKLADPATVSACSADNDIFIGIAAEEKIANDGKTKIAVYTKGIFKMTVSSTGSTVGLHQVIKGANTIGDYTTLDDEKGYVIGKALETGTNGETILVLVGGTS